MADLFPYQKRFLELARDGKFVTLGDSIGQGGGRGTVIIMTESADISPEEWENLARVVKPEQSQ